LSHTIEGYSIDFQAGSRIATAELPVPPLQDPHAPSLSPFHRNTPCYCRTRTRPESACFFTTATCATRLVFVSSFSKFGSACASVRLHLALLELLRVVRVRLCVVLVPLCAVLLCRACASAPGCACKCNTGLNKPK
jgi:hypothetical protein